MQIYFRSLDRETGCSICCLEQMVWELCYCGCRTSELNDKKKKKPRYYKKSYPPIAPAVLELRFILVSAVSQWGGEKKWRRKRRISGGPFPEQKWCETNCASARKETLGHQQTHFLNTVFVYFKDWRQIQTGNSGPVCWLKLNSPPSCPLKCLKAQTEKRSVDLRMNVQS